MVPEVGGGLVVVVPRAASAEFAESIHVMPSKRNALKLKEVFMAGIG